MGTLFNEASKTDISMRHLMRFIMPWFLANLSKNRSTFFSIYFGKVWSWIFLEVRWTNKIIICLFFNQFPHVLSTLDKKITSHGNKNSSGRLNSQNNCNLLIDFLAKYFMSNLWYVFHEKRMLKFHECFDQSKQIVTL